MDGLSEICSPEDSNGSQEDAAKKTVGKSLTPKVSRPLMQGYGLPKDKKGLLPWKWAEQRLKQSHNYWITTVKPERAPHTMVVWGLWLDGAFLFSTGSQSRKARNLAENRGLRGLQRACARSRDHRRRR